MIDKNKEIIPLKKSNTLQKENSYQQIKKEW